MAVTDSALAVPGAPSDVVATPVTAPVRRLPRSLSHSSMAAYETCPKKFEFSRIDRIPDPPGRPMLVGTFAHAVLEDLMRADPETRTVGTAQRIARRRWDGWFSRNEDFVRLGLDEGEQREFRKDAWSSVEGYFAIEDPRAVEIVAVEKKVEATLEGVSVMGFVDRIEKNGGETVVSDYKTGKVPGAAYKEEALAQPHLYAAMLAENGVVVDRYRMLYVNGRQEVSGSVGSGDIDSARQRAADTWGAINDDFTAGHFDPHPSKLCSWCGYKEICPAFR